MQREGYDPRLTTDQIYFLNSRAGRYELVTEEMYNAFEEGKISLWDEEEKVVWTYLVFWPVTAHSVTTMQQNPLRFVLLVFRQFLHLHFSLNKKNCFWTGFFNLVASCLHNDKLNIWYAIDETVRENYFILLYFDLMVAYRWQNMCTPNLTSKKKKKT